MLSLDGCIVQVLAAGSNALVMWRFCIVCEFGSSRRLNSFSLTLLVDSQTTVKCPNHS